MKQGKLEVTLEGSFTTIEVFVEGQRIKLFEKKEHVYTRTYEKFEVNDTLDIVCNLYGWRGRDWKLEVKFEGTSFFADSGTFDKSGFVKIKKSIQL
jgi:hypothetical protein